MSNGALAELDESRSRSNHHYEVIRAPAPAPTQQRPRSLYELWGRNNHPSAELKLPNFTCRINTSLELITHSLRNTIEQQLVDDLSQYWVITPCKLTPLPDTGTTAVFGSGHVIEVWLRKEISKALLLPSLLMAVIVQSFTSHCLE